MTIYTYLDRKIKGQLSKEFTQKVQCEYIHLEDCIGMKQENYIPDDAKCVVVHGVLRGNDKVIREARKRNIDWVYMDNAYLGKYKRATLNSSAPHRIITKSPPRFKVNYNFQPWRGGKGKNILILPPSPPYMDTFGARDFLNELVHNLNKYTARDMVVRAKPADGKLARPLIDQLNEAYCVVTWGSAIAITAMQMGIPTISLGYCPAGAASKHPIDLETSRMNVCPDRKAVINNLTHVCFERNELPNAWGYLMKVYGREGYGAK